MIQPLRGAKNIWALDWVEVDEPFPDREGFILPTCLYVVREAAKPMVGQEMIPEMDQRRAENLLARLMEEKGTPDEVLVRDLPDWDRRIWQNFGKDFDCEVRFVGSEDEASTAALARTVRERVAEEVREACLSASRGQRPAAVAAALVRSAMALRSRERRGAFLEKARAMDPRNGEALLELGEMAMQSGSLKDALKHYGKAVEIEVPRWEGFRVNWWKDRETRIYLRAVFGRMLVHWHNGRFEPAIEEGERLLELNATDNQGVRFLLPMLHQLAEQPDRAAAFYSEYEKRYPKDYPEPSFQFGWGLTLSQHEDEAGAIARYRKGMLRNIYIAPLLLDLPEPRSDIWHPSDRSEPGYAYEFFDSYAGLWERDTAVLRILREAHQSVEADLVKLLELRSRMADFQDQRYDPQHDAHWKALLDEEKAILGEADRTDAA